MTLTFKHAIGCIGLCLMLAACGQKNTTDGGAVVFPDAGTTDAGGPPPPPPPPPPPVPADLAGAPTLDMTGTWATRVVNAQIFKGPLGQETVTITTVARVQAMQTGTTVHAMSHVCSVNLSPYMKEQTLYPPAAVQAIPDETSDGQLSAAAIGATYTPHERVQLIGWKANGDAKTEKLPTKGDPRIYDADMDGKPGVTLQIKGGISGDVYIVNRSIVDFSGTVINDGKIKGTSHTEQEQNVLDSSNPFLKGQVTTTPDPDASKSKYDMVRTKPGMDTCEAILAMVNTLFN